MTLDLRGVLIAVALQAEFEGCCRDELDACHIFCDPNFVATQAAFFIHGMNKSPFGLVFMTRNAGGSGAIAPQSGMLLRNRRN